ncbi:MAG: ATP-binding cassette domain-containing protein [Pseudomonadota bacterium]
MLTIHDLHFTLEGRKLFDGASAQIPQAARVGVLGRNGTGKTTLFRLIRGELSPEQGAIETPRGARIGGVDQEIPASDDSLLDLVLRADRERAGLLAAAETETDPHRIAEIQTRLADIDAHSAEARAAQILSGLGFDAAAQARPSRAFSGGWRMRAALAGALFSAPDLLLLDEPTNYLDLEGAVWLESYLARYPRACLVISHDRGLLNGSVDAILHLDRGKLSYFAGRYDRFDAERRERLAHQGALKKKQDAQRAHLQAFVDRFRAKATKARQAQSRLKMLERMQPIAALTEDAVAPFSFPSPEPLNPPILAVEDAVVGYDDAPVLSRLNFRIDQDDRIALLGANGQGKSTLAKLLSGRLAPMAGAVRRSSKLRIGFFAQHQLEDLVPEETAVQHIQRLRPDEPPAKLRARLGAAGLTGPLGEAPVRTLSGGQRARLAMTLATLDAPHLILLDEPTNHLDIESREALAQALAAYAGAVILISHDPYLVGSVADRLWLVSDGGVAPYDGDLEDYKRLLLSQRGAGGRAAEHAAAEKVATRKAQKRSAAETRKALSELRREVSAAEARVQKLEEMRALVEDRLADPDLYAGPSDRVEALMKKQAEVADGLARAEAIWTAAMERLEEEEAAG